MTHVSARRALALIAAGLAVSAAALSTAARPAHASSASTVKYYFHGSPADDANRAGSLTGATNSSAKFDTNAPTGTTDATQTASGVANESLAQNPLAAFWVNSTISGTFNGTFHFDWWWTSENPEVAAGAQDQVDIGVFGDGNLISRDSSGHPAAVSVNLNPGTTGTPVENTADIPVSGSVIHSFVIQVSGHFSDSSESDTVHYDTTSSPSFFTAPTPAPIVIPSPTAAPCTTSVCFGAPVVLPLSGATGGTDQTCYAPCGEPSLVVSPVDGTLYVSTPRTLFACCNSLASPVWKSGDDGSTWSQPIFPSAPGGHNPLTGGDTELAVDKRGTVYEGELWLGSDSIYVSPDKGQTWNWSPASHDVGADREWFVYSPQEDALYGWYDGFKALMVVKAPLNTPLGSTTAQFFPVERPVVPECAAAQATNCPDVADSAAGIPLIPSDVSPGRPSISPVDGTLYFPFPYQLSGKGVGIATTSDGGQSYSYDYVTGAGGGTLGDTGNDFPVSAVDSAGNLYVAWVENKGDGFNLYFAASKDKGATWSTPVEVSKGISATAVFPNIVAGSAGQVAVSWYGNSVKADPNDGKTLGNSPWSVYASEALNATSAQPAFTTGLVQQNFHTGVICTQGAGCTGTSRELLDFFDMKIDPNGSLLVVYARDQFTGSGTEIAFARQVGGCNLNQPCGPVASTPETPAVPALGGAGLLAAVLSLAIGRRHRKKLPSAAV